LIVENSTSLSKNQVRQAHDIGLIVEKVSSEFSRERSVGNPFWATFLISENAHQNGETCFSLSISAASVYSFPPTLSGLSPLVGRTGDPNFGNCTRTPIGFARYALI
jgi:hypothetical protein